MAEAITQLSIVIPCFNEAEVIPSFVPRVFKSLEELLRKKLIQSFELIVVNDQSTDRSQELLEKHKNLKIISTQNQNRGYGNALKSGFSQAQGEWIGFFDMDGTYRPEDLILFINEIKKNESDFIMGSRSFKQKGMSLTRGFGNGLYRILAQFFYGSTLGDVCSGYRIFHRRHLKNILEIQEEGLSFSIQLTLDMIVQKIKIKQISISYDERLGSSKLSVIKDGFAFLKVILTLKMRRLYAFKHSRV